MYHTEKLLFLALIIFLTAFFW